VVAGVPARRFGCGEIAPIRQAETPAATIRRLDTTRGDRINAPMRGLIFVVLASWAAAYGAAPPVPKTNIIIIVADDLGYSDLGCYGSKTIATPRLDRMAKEGIRFTDAYSAAPFCSPSRAALLTGRLPARAGLPYVLFPAEHMGLPSEEITIAELLKQNGYATACIGKWHLGWDKPFRPQQQGFDVFFGTPYSNDSNEWPVGSPFLQVMGLVPFPLIDGDRIVEAPADQSQLTRRYTERAVAFIRQNRARPFFIYLPHTMPHVPQYTREGFGGKSRAGLYGDTVEELDWSTGVILDTLHDLQIAERTLVVFTSDNGSPLRRNPNAPGAKAKAPFATKAPAFATERFPGRVHAGSNGELRGGKGTTFEGGVRVPLIAWRPGTIGANRQEAALFSHLDLFPTCATIAGAKLPGDRVYDGHDFGVRLDLIERAAPIYHYFGYQLQAMRDRNWKLFLRTTQRPEPRPPSLWWDHQPRLFETQHRLLAEPELYDLSRDPGESKNVAAQNIEVIEQLTARAYQFDTALQRDRRPMQIVEGPVPPAPQTIRTPETDLALWQKLHAP
jgi:arylsulfatase A